MPEYGLPQPKLVDNDRFARVYHREINYDQSEQRTYVELNIPLLTSDKNVRFMTAFVL